MFPPIQCIVRICKQTGDKG